MPSLVNAIAFLLKGNSSLFSVTNVSHQNVALLSPAARAAIANAQSVEELGLLALIISCVTFTILYFIMPQIQFLNYQFR